MDHSEQSRWPHTGAILIGGKSARMGTPKHALQLPGGTMLEHVAETMRAVCAGIVVVGSPTPSLGEHGANRTEHGYETLADLRTHAGPLGGIEALLASGIDSQYIVCPCDIPLIAPKVLQGLTRESSSPITALQFDGDDEPQSLPLRIEADLLPFVREQLERGERAIHRLLARDDLEVELVRAPDHWRELLRNINTPEEFERLREEQDSPQRR